MIFRLSRQTYRLVGRLDEGDELVDVLTRICKESKITAGEIRAVGSFDEMELVRFDSGARDYRPLLDGKGEYELVSLDGNISTLGNEPVLRLEGLVSVMGPVGPQVVAGQIRSAKAISAEFVVDVFDDLKISRRLDPQTGRLLLDEIEIVAPTQAAVPVASISAGATENTASMNTRSTNAPSANAPSPNAPSTNAPPARPQPGA